MKFIRPLLLACLCLVLAGVLQLTQLRPFSQSTALADSSTVTLLPGARADYRFDYEGDRTLIRIALDYGGMNGVDLFIYTPAQILAAGRGDPLVPIARGTSNSGHDLFWAGGFPARGVYQVRIVNHTPGIILYRLGIDGPGVSNVAPIVAAPPPSNATLSFNTLTVSLPPGANQAPLRFIVPGPPPNCTHASQVPPLLSYSIKLCPDEVYAPIHLVGNGLAVYADEAHRAVITSGGRQFAVTIEGNNNLLEGVTVQSSPDAADQGAWLCQYPECIFPTQPNRTVINGGIIYGGGILVRGSYTVIHAVTVRGGTIGVATVGGVGNALVENELNGLNGWGSFNLGSSNSYFVGNSLDGENHPCTTPDGYKFLHGCETAGWVCLGCQGNLIARNTCEGSGNCFYMSGERNLASNNNRLIGNYCAGATDNCFELTFSRGNLLQDNVATSDPRTGANCKYPFWIGGSTVYFKGNSWQCGLDPDKAIADATASTTMPTLALDLYGPYTPSAAVTSLPAAATTAPTPSPATSPSLPFRIPRGYLE